MAIKNYKELVNESKVQKDCEKYDISYNSLNEKQQNLLCAADYAYDVLADELDKHYKAINNICYGVNNVADIIGITKQALYKKNNSKDIVNQIVVDYINKKKIEFESYKRDRHAYYNREALYDKKLMNQLLTHEIEHQQTKLKLIEADNEIKRLNKEIERLNEQMNKSKN